MYTDRWDHQIKTLPCFWSEFCLFYQNLGQNWMRHLRANFRKICQWTKKIKEAVYGWSRQIFPKSPKEHKLVNRVCLFKKIDSQYAFTGKRTKTNARENIEALNVDSGSGKYEGFQTPFCRIYLSPDFGYEVPKRGPLFWPVIDSVQSSPRTIVVFDPDWKRECP